MSEARAGVGIPMAAEVIEALIESDSWDLAQSAIEEDLRNDPDNHWLWSRLATVRYEKRNYASALRCAEKALTLVPDCPLPMWDQAGAFDMLGRWDDALRIYTWLIGRGAEQLRNPDEDANECWEGSDWTKGLVIDCVFRAAGCLAKMGHQRWARELYSTYLMLLDLDVPKGIYSREEALVGLKKIDTQGKTVVDSPE